MPSFIKSQAVDRAHTAREMQESNQQLGAAKVQLAFKMPTYSGDGSPEGVISAVVGKSYWDATNGALYAKRTGTGNTGWVQIGFGEIKAVFSWPGLANALVGAMSGSFPIQRTSPVTVANVAATLPYGTTADADLTVGFYLNGTEFTTLTIVSGQNQVEASGSFVTTPGLITDGFSAKITVYGGSTVSGVVAQIEAS